VKRKNRLRNLSVLVASILLLAIPGVGIYAATDRITFILPKTLDFSQIPYQLPTPKLNGNDTYFTSVSATPANVCSVEEEYTENAANETRAASYSLYASSIGTCSITGFVYGSNVSTSATVSIIKANAVITTPIVDATIPIYQGSIPISASVDGEPFRAQILVQASSALICEIKDDSNSAQSLFLYKTGTCKIDFKYFGDPFTNANSFTRTLKIVSTIDPRTPVNAYVTDISKTFENGGVKFNLEAATNASLGPLPTISWREMIVNKNGSGCGVDSDYWNSPSVDVWIYKIGKCRIQLFTQSNDRYQKSKIKIIKLDQLSKYSNEVTFVSPNNPDNNGNFPTVTGSTLFTVKRIDLPLNIKSGSIYDDWTLTDTTSSVCSTSLISIDKITYKIRVSTTRTNPGEDCKFRIMVPAQKLFLDYSKEFTIRLN